MKRYVEQNDYWKTGKALTFFANFIRHHNKNVENNDTFDPVAELLPPSELKRLVEETFPAKTIARMQDSPFHCGTLVATPRFMYLVVPFCQVPSSQ